MAASSVNERMLRTVSVVSQGRVGATGRKEGPCDDTLLAVVGGEGERSRGLLGGGVVVATVFVGGSS